MDILLVNGTHPATPHISGVRAGRFADELAKLGHRCVLICPAPQGRSPAPRAPLGQHDWSAPYISEVDDPAPAQSAGPATLISLIRHGGRRAGFRHAVLAAGRALGTEFRPQVGWGTFGTLEGVVALRTLAREQNFPWIFDDKDNPDIYVPRLARAPLAWRLRGYAALHGNSALHAAAAERWLGGTAEVVYSGVDDCFFPTGAARPDRRYLTLIGSLYYREVVAEIVDAVADYNTTSGRPPLDIVHLGTQGAWLENDRGVAVEAPGYVSAEEMAALCHNAVANLYVFLGRTFHHKLFELLACRRPVIAYGGELPESIAVAEQLHAPLAIPRSPTELGATLAAAESYTPDPAMPDRFFTWREQAAMVERAMRRLVE